MLERLKQFKIDLMSNTARAALRFDVRLLIGVGVICTVAAVSLYVLESLAARGDALRSDTILRMRLSSPKPAHDIVIVDIDERSLVLLAKKHGTWPWSRELQAEGLQKLLDAGPKAVLFSIMLSDRNPKQPDADAAMEITASLAKNVAYPMIRLNPDNDGQSKLKVTQIPDARLSEGTPNDRTLAIILPAFPPMHARMGVGSPQLDDDGIVRKYPLHWTEPEFTLPSIVLKTLEAAGLDTKDLPNNFTINWRNKRGRYQRISFADMLAMDPESREAKAIRNAYVVVGLSAPGIGQTKPTAVNAVMDDNEIFATALDDAIHKTYLRTPPDWLLLILTIAGTWGLVLLAIRRTPATQINAIFVYAQVALGGVMLIGASYANYLIDLSSTMSYLFIVFAAIKLICTIGHASAAAVPGYRKSDISPTARHLVLIGMRKDQMLATKINEIEKRLFNAVGINNVIRIDDLFGGHNFLASQMEKYVAFVVLADDVQQPIVEAALLADASAKVKIHRDDLPVGTDIEGEVFRAHVTGLLTANAAALFSA